MFVWVVRLYANASAICECDEPSQLVQFLLIRKCIKCQEAPHDDAFLRYRPSWIVWTQ